MSEPLPERADPGPAERSGPPARPGAPARPGVPAPPLGAAPRLAWTLAGWAALFAGAPGTWTPHGVLPLTLLGFGAWAAAAHRPGPRAPLVEGLAGALGWCGLMGWAACVWEPLLLWIGPAHGLYVAAAGALLRRLVRRLPLPLAASLAWVAVETLRGFPPPPFGLESYQLGHALHATAGLVGSARVWGVGGLGMVAGTLGGLVAVGLLRRRPRPADLAAGLLPAAVALALASAVPAPELRPGPRVLLVQPAFEQDRKQYGDRYRNHLETARLTLDAIAALPEERWPDLVCWGETMVPTTIFEEAVLGALLSGWEPPADQRRWLTPAVVARERDAEEALVREGLVERLPPGTSFLSGVEVFRWTDGAVERGNGVVVWDRAGGRSDPALKRHVVPGAENMLGLERFDAVRAFVLDVAGYVPNLSAGEGTGVLELRGRDGTTWRFGASVCFDNAFLDPYTEPLRRTEIDFHVVVSNEAWYGRTWEAHQMMAYSRVIATATGRSLVRATNSGVSAVLAPDGGEQRLVGEGGEDRMVRGTLLATVPVPASDADARRTPFVRTEGLWHALWPALGLLLALGRGRRPAAGREQARNR